MLKFYKFISHSVYYVLKSANCVRKCVDYSKLVESLVALSGYKPKIAALNIDLKLGFEKN